MSEHEEARLRRAELRAPSDALDARIEKLLATPNAPDPPLMMRPVRLWHLATACALCTLAAFFAGTLLRPAPEAPVRTVEVRYVIQPEQQAFDVFDWTRYPKTSAPTSILKRAHTSTEAASET